MNMRGLGPIDFEMVGISGVVGVVGVEIEEDIMDTVEAGLVVVTAKGDIALIVGDVGSVSILVIVSAASAD